MLKNIEEIKNNFRSEIEKIDSKEALEAFRVKFLGRKGMVANAFAMLASASREEKPLLGKALNELKKEIDAAYKQVSEKIMQGLKKSEQIDLSLPGRRAFTAVSIHI